ncbi:MAG: rod shape-determining protein MreD [Lachnospiraceae bacterium]|nr:rod shape-determining protein MreD [Lachnospiraceae bacterium]
MLINVVFALIVIIVYLIQTTFADAIELGNIVPNLVVIIVCMYSLLRGRRAGLIFGFMTGLLLDVFNGYGNVIGINALLYMYVGFINGIFNDIIYIHNFHIPVVAVALSDLALSFINYVITFLMRNKLDFVYYLRNIIIPEVIYTIFVTLLLFKVILMIYKKLCDYESRKEANIDQGDI